MFLYAAHKVLIIGKSECGRHVEHIFAAECERALFGESALAAPDTAEDQGSYSYEPPLSCASRSERNASRSRSFSSFFRTATRKNSGPSPRKGSQPRTRIPLWASSSGSHRGPRTSKKFAAPGYA